MTDNGRLPPEAERVEIPADDADRAVGAAWSGKCVSLWCNDCRWCVKNNRCSRVHREGNGEGPPKGNTPATPAEQPDQRAGEAEPFGYWIEQRHAEPVLLRKPAYIPEPSELRTVTPLYLHPSQESHGVEGEAAFAIGQRVEKISGSSWRGKVVGTYSTTLTPEGYAVESENEPGSVQIYPAKALRAALGKEGA